MSWIVFGPDPPAPVAVDPDAETIEVYPLYMYSTVELVMKRWDVLHARTIEDLKQAWSTHGYVLLESTNGLFGIVRVLAHVRDNVFSLETATGEQHIPFPLEALNQEYWVVTPKRLASGEEVTSILLWDAFTIQTAHMYASPEDALTEWTLLQARSADELCEALDETGYIMVLADKGTYAVTRVISYVNGNTFMLSDGEENFSVQLSVSDYGRSWWAVQPIAHPPALIRVPSEVAKNQPMMNPVPKLTARPDPIAIVPVETGRAGSAGAPAPFELDVLRTFNQPSELDAMWKQKVFPVENRDIHMRAYFASHPSVYIAFVAVDGQSSIIRVSGVSGNNTLVVDDDTKTTIAVNFNVYPSAWVIVKPNPENTRPIRIVDTHCVMCARVVTHIIGGATFIDDPAHKKKHGVRCHMHLCTSVTCIKCVRKMDMRRFRCIVCAADDRDLVMQAGPNNVSWLVDQPDVNDDRDQDKENANVKFIEAAAHARRATGRLNALVLDCGRTTGHLIRHFTQRNVNVFTVDAHPRCKDLCATAGAQNTFVGRMSTFLRTPEAFRSDIKGVKFDVVWLDYFGNFFGNKSTGVFPMQDTERALAFRLRRDGTHKVFAITVCLRGKKIGIEDTFKIVFALIERYGWSVVNYDRTSYRNIHTLYTVLQSPSELPINDANETIEPLLVAGKAGPLTTGIIGRRMRFFNTPHKEGVVQWYDVGGPYHWTCVSLDGNTREDFETVTYSGSELRRDFIPDEP